MVEKSDLDQVNTLYREYTSIADVLNALDSGGRIISMQVSAGPPEVAGMVSQRPLVADTSGFDYPPAMVESVKQQLRARQTAIDAELAGLGVGQAAR